MHHGAGKAPPLACLCPAFGQPHDGPCTRDQIIALIRHRGLRLRAQSDAAMARYLLTDEWRYWETGAVLAFEAATLGVAA
jgi:hypothetical protein